MEVCMRGGLVVAMVMAVGLAGCVGDDESFVPEECEDAVLCNPDEFFDTHFCTVEDVRPRVYAPDTAGPDSAASPWDLGRSWTYSLKLDGVEHPDTQLIYYAIQDNGAHYMVGTPTRDEALRHAVESTNPVIGRVHKTLYSPHESGVHADMFHFPLCAGSTWSDVFFDTLFDFTAKPETILLPDGTEDPLGFRIDGTSGDGSTITHTYSPTAKWFTELHVALADGSTVDMELTQLATGYTGDAYFLRGQKDEVIDLSNVGQSWETTVSRVHTSAPYDTVGISMELERTVGSGRVEVQVINPSGEQVACIGLAGDELAGGETECPAGPLLLEVPYEEGDWTVSVELPLFGGTEIDGEVRLASIYDRSGTVQAPQAT